MKATAKEKEAMREYYQKNKMHLLVKAREYAATHPRNRKAYAAVYRNKYRERLNAQIVAYQRSVKLAVYDAYGNACKCCGESEPKFLGIDHRLNNGAAEKKVFRNTSNLLRHIQKNNYPADYQLLCHNCNLGRYLNGGTCPHQERVQLCAVS